MKMAKASDADIEMAMTVANILDDIDRGYFPSKLAADEDSEETEWIDTNDREQYARLIEGLREVLSQGSIFLVVWGMAVVCDPINECIDPDADCIEHHPKRKQLEQQRDELLAAIIEARHALQFANDNPGGGINDTIWMMHRSETLFDFMDAAIAKVKGGAA